MGSTFSNDRGRLNSTLALPKKKKIIVEKETAYPGDKSSYIPPKDETIADVAPVADDNALPLGWEEIFDNASRVPYYRHENGISTWDRPSADDKPEQEEQDDQPVADTEPLPKECCR